jgi:hypothetical protein
VWTFLVLICFLAFVGSLVALLFKSVRRKAKWIAPASFVAMIVAATFFGGEQNDEARRLGFLDAADQRAAKDAGVTDPAAWRAASEAKRQAEQAVTSVNPDTNQKTNAGRMLSGVGRATICATKDMTFDDYRVIKLPPTSVFRDSGPLKGDVRDPWGLESQVSERRLAAFITTDPVTLTKAEPCAESGVRMLIGKLYKEPFAIASDRRVWEIDDVLEYSPASGRPPVEFGKLIDDISVRAVLLADAGDPLVLAKDEADEAAHSAKCLAESQKVAAHERGVIKRQTSSVVTISHPAAVEFSFGCDIDGMKPDVFIAWNKSRPVSSTVKLIKSAGEFLTGATSEEIKQELAKCVNGALKPDAGEISAREFGGVRIECQAFERDGGGGSATIYRRFGAYPVHDMPEEKVLSEIMREFEPVDTSAHKNLDFLKPLWAIGGGQFVKPKTSWAYIDKVLQAAALSCLQSYSLALRLLRFQPDALSVFLRVRDILNSISLLILVWLTPGHFVWTRSTISESAIFGFLLRRNHRHADSIAACSANERSKTSIPIISDISFPSAKPRSFGQAATPAAKVTTSLPATTPREKRRHRQRRLPTR